MNISINVSELLGRNNNTSNGTGINQSGLKSGSVLSNKKYRNTKVTSASGVFGASKVNKGNKVKLSVAAIAKKIAQGKHVTQEERAYLQKNDPQLYRKAQRANRLREELEDTLKSAKSDTAKASAIAAVTSQATALAQADAKSEGTSDISGAELFTDAIKAALSKFGSKKLNEEMEQYTQINKNSLMQDERENDDQGTYEDFLEVKSSSEDASSNRYLEK